MRLSDRKALSKPGSGRGSAAPVDGGTTGGALRAGARDAKPRAPPSSLPVSGPAVPGPAVPGPRSLICGASSSADPRQRAGPGGSALICQKSDLQPLKKRCF